MLKNEEEKISLNSRRTCGGRTCDENESFEKSARKVLRFETTSGKSMPNNF